MSFPWFSLEQIEAVPLAKRSNVALVSISSVPEDFADREGFGAVLRVCFDDLTPESAEGIWLGPNARIRLFTEDDALGIWEFVLDARSRGMKVWIHCRMGISRSAATAAALGTLLEQDGLEPFERAIPNPFVYQIMMAVGRRVLGEAPAPESDQEVTMTEMSPLPLLSDGHPVPDRDSF